MGACESCWRECDYIPPERFCYSCQELGNSTATNRREMTPGLSTHRVRSVSQASKSDAGMSTVAEFYRYLCWAGLLLFSLSLIVGFGKLFGGYSSDTNAGIALIAVGGVGLATLGPSAILLVIMDNLSSIKRIMENQIINRG